MDIKNKLDQFIKSARFILNQREFQKQAAYPLYDFDMGQRNAANFQRNVNLNPRPRYPSYSRPRSYSAPRQQQTQNRAPTQPDARKLWSQLANAAKTPKHLQQMVNIAPRLIGDRDDYQELLDRGMRYAIGNINRATGSNYSWFGGKLDLTGGASAARPATPRPVAPRTPGYTPRSTTTPTTRPTAPSTASSVAPRGRGKSFYMPPDPDEDNSGVFDNVRWSYDRNKKIYDGFSRSGDLDFKTMASDIASEVYTDVFNAIRRYHGNIDSWEQALELAGIPIDEPLGQQVLQLCKRNALSPTETVQQVQEYGKIHGQIVHPYYSTNTLSPTTTTPTATTPAPTATTRPTTPRPTTPPRSTSGWAPSKASLDRSISRSRNGMGDTLVDYKRPRTLPGMPPATPTTPTRSMPTMGSSYGYGAPPSSSGAGSSFSPRPTRTGSF